MLPNLIVIGAAKSGTTSLHSYLGEHPEVFMATPQDAPSLNGGLVANDAVPKEMRFWWRDDWRDRLAWYESRFETDAPVRGEATPAYTLWPFFEDVPDRIHGLIPDVRLIYIVRDPVKRMVAHYVQMRVDGDRRSFADWMAELDDPRNRIVTGSRYATQVERYLRVFDRSQLLVLDQQDLRDARQATLAEAFRFLGVDPDFTSPAFERIQNARDQKFELTRWGAPLYHQVVNPVGRRLYRDRWTALRPKARRALSKPVDAAPEIDAALRRRLEAVFRPEAERLRELTGKPFAGWSV